MKKNTIYVAIISSDRHAPIYKAYKSRYDAVDITATSIFDSRSEARDNLNKYGYHYDGRSNSAEIVKLDYDGDKSDCIHLVSELTSKGTGYKAFASRLDAYQAVFGKVAEIRGGSDIGEERDIATKRLDEGLEYYYGYEEGTPVLFNCHKVPVMAIE